MRIQEVAKIVRGCLVQGDRGFKLLAREIDKGDPYSWGHSERVARYAVSLAQDAELDDDAVDRTRRAALVHDLGRLLLPEEIFTKPGALSAADRAMVRRLPAQAARVLERVGQCPDVARVVRHHRERVDGRGYPEGLVGTEVPEESRVIAVVEAYDAMVSARSFRGALAVDEALARLRRNAGTQFDQMFVASFAQTIESRQRERFERMSAATVFVELSIREYEKDVQFYLRKYPGVPAGDLVERLLVDHREIDRAQAGRVVAWVLDPGSVEEDLYSDDVDWIKEDEVVVRHPALIDADVGSVVVFRGRLYVILDILPLGDGRFEYRLKR